MRRSSFRSEGFVLPFVFVLLVINALYLMDIAKSVQLNSVIFNFEQRATKAQVFADSFADAILRTWRAAGSEGEDFNQATVTQINYCLDSQAKLVKSCNKGYFKTPGDSADYVSSARLKNITEPFYQLLPDYGWSYFRVEVEASYNEATNRQVIEFALSTDINEPETLVIQRRYYY